MIPVLLLAAATNFDAAGLPLCDAVSCAVKQDDQARSELTLRYPCIGDHFDEIKTDVIIMAKPDPFTRAQPFRVYKASRPIDGLVSFSARHLIYDALGIPIAPFTASSASQAAQRLISGALTSCPFTLSTDMVKTKDMALEVPSSLREALATGSNSFLKTYGGALSFDRYAITHRASPCVDRGVVIRYGVDLVDFQQEENIANTYNGILPYWKGTRTTTVSGEITAQTQEVVLGSKRMAPGAWPVEKILPVDFTAYFGDDSPPTAAQLDALSDTWIADHGVGVPAVSLALRYADIGQDVRLFDLVTVDFTLLKLQTHARITATSFDVLHEIYTDVQVGGPRPELSDSLMDASRLKNGTLPADRIGQGSIGGSKLATASVSEAALAAYAVTKNRLANLAVSSGKIQAGAVIEEKLAAEAVTTPKIRDKAVTYDCLSLAVQQLFVDVIEANRVYAGYISSDGGLAANWVYARQMLVVQGGQFSSTVYNLRLADGGTTGNIRLLKASVG